MYSKTSDTLIYDIVLISNIMVLIFFVKNLMKILLFFQNDFLFERFYFIVCQFGKKFSCVFLFFLYNTETISVIIARPLS